MNASEIQVRMIDPKAVKVFVHRVRDAEEQKRIKQSMRERLVIPIQVRDISDWPKAERKRPDGGLYLWELICGEGRLENALALKWDKIPATIPKAEQVEIIGRFLVENLIRKPLPWAEKAQLVKAELDSGKTTEEVAAMFFISEAHVEKCRRILSKGAAWLGDEIAAMSMNEAESLTTLQPDEQSIVVEVLRDTAAVEGNVQVAVAQAKALKAEIGTLSATALKKSLTRVEDEIKAEKEEAQVVNHYWSIGPGNLLALLENPKYRKALRKAGVSIEKFESLTA